MGISSCQYEYEIARDAEPTSRFVHKADGGITEVDVSELIQVAAHQLTVAIGARAHTEFGQRECVGALNRSLSALEMATQGLLGDPGSAVQGDSRERIMVDLARIALHIGNDPRSIPPDMDPWFELPKLICRVAAMLRVTVVELRHSFD